jgi:hypothetical protein
LTDPLAQAFSPAVLRALVELIDERVALALAEQNGARPRWLPLREAAPELGLSYDAARMRAKRKQLNTHRQGERIYVDMDNPFGGCDSATVRR